MSYNPCVFFTSLLDGLLLDFEEQQVSTRIHNTEWVCSTMLSSERSRFIFRFPTLPVRFLSLCEVIASLLITIVTLMFYTFLSSPARSKYLPHFFLSLIFTLLSTWNSKDLFFKTRSSHLVRIWRAIIVIIIISVLANFSRSPGLFLVFKPIWTMLLLLCPRFFFWFPIPSITSLRLGRPFQALQIQSVLPPPSCSAVLDFFLFGKIQVFVNHFTSYWIILWFFLIIVWLLAF